MGGPFLHTFDMMINYDFWTGSKIECDKSCIIWWPCCIPSMVFQLGPDIRTCCPLGADASSFAQPELQNRFDLAGTPRDRRQSDKAIGNEDWLVEAPNIQRWDYPDVWWWLYLLVSFLRLTLADWKLKVEWPGSRICTSNLGFHLSTDHSARSPALMWFTISPSAQVAMGASGLSQFFGEREFLNH